MHGGTSIDQAFAVAAAPNGDVAVVGASGSFGDGTMDVLVVRLNGTTGSVVWARDWGGTSLEYGYGVTVAPNGDVLR
jgi:hypothetical protein